MNTRQASTFVSAVTLCLAGSQSLSQIFEGSGVRLYSWTPLALLPGAPISGSGCSGYTSPSGREYAIMGQSNGNSFVEITNPSSPVNIAHIAGPLSTWHEQAVLGPFCYAVTEAGGGMQVIDMRQIDGGLVSLSGVFVGNGFSRAHSIQANTASNHVYLNGSNLSSGGLVAVNVTNPATPVISGAWTTRYVHDSLVITYTSGTYAGREIAFLCCGGSGLYVVDVTNKANMMTLDSILYPDTGYCHSGALTADKRFFLINDEFDESNGLGTATTHIINVENLSDITYAGRYTNGVNVIDHNSMIRDGYLFLSAYRGGLRVYDIRNVPTIRETGYFDTYPEGQGLGYDGAWGVNASFASGTVIISDIDRGLFVVDPFEAAGGGARLVDLAFDRGSLVSGGLADLVESDDEYVVTLNGPSPIQTERSSTRVVIGLETTVRQITRFDVTVEAKLGREAPRGALTVAFKNWGTGNFVDVASFQTTTSDQVFTANDVPASSYVNAMGRIEIRLHSVNTAPTLTSTYRTYFDQVKVFARRN